MTTTSSHSHTFTLDKAHFNECYSQSVVNDQSVKAYFKSIILSLFGIILVLFSDVNVYAAWFVFALGILEAVSLYYRQPWWVMRQLLGKSGNNEVTLTVDEKGIAINSFYIKSMVLWDNMSAIKKTSLGWVICHELGNNYISDSCLSSDAISLFNKHLTTTNSDNAK